MATRADVANLAGVSESTVSYALSGKRPISTETRNRVLLAVEKLNYHPNFAAHVLAGGQTKTIALLFPENKHGIPPISLEYVSGAARTAYKNGYHLVLIPSSDITLEEIQRYKESGLLSGVILMEIRLYDERVEYLETLKVPFALIGRTASPENLIYVDRDFEEVIRLGFDCLTSMGHKNIAVLAQLRKIHGSKLGVDSRFLQSIKSSAKKMKLDVHLLQTENTSSAGRSSFIELRAQHPEVTAVLSLPDLATLGFMTAANEFNCAIPEDLSVLSVNMPQNQIELTWPPLSTIEVPAFAMGASATQKLIDSIEGKKLTNKSELFVGDLQLRGSTASLDAQK
jgi:DNA-binding LacI/PurR family transcriptional regulator